MLRISLQRFVEHRPVACVPSPENIRDSPLAPNQRVTNRLGTQTESGFVEKVLVLFVVMYK